MKKNTPFKKLFNKLASNFKPTIPNIIIDSIKYDQNLVKKVEKKN